jgi:hypothetical protein
VTVLPAVRALNTRRNDAGLGTVGLWLWAARSSLAACLQEGRRKVDGVRCDSGWAEATQGHYIDVSQGESMGGCAAAVRWQP